jgi:20S proteasome subunit beta 2
MERQQRPDGGSNAGGFDFEFVKRNAMLAAKGVKPPTAWKTGTTIAGVIYKVGRGRMCCVYL